MTAWQITREGFDSETHNHLAPVHALGNGFLCCRGFREEAWEGIAGLGGIYMAGVFGLGSYVPWKGQGQELANVPNFLATAITINDQPLQENVQNLSQYKETLDLHQGILTREYVYTENKEALASFVFTRFISRADIALAGQQIRVIPHKDGLDIKMDLCMNGQVTQLNEVSSEPYPIQPGKKHLHILHQDARSLCVRVAGAKDIYLAFAQKVYAPGLDIIRRNDSLQVRIQKPKGESITIEKLVTIARPAVTPDVLQEAKELMAKAPDYTKALSAHVTSLKEFWEMADVTIQGDDAMLLSLRYNIFQLDQSCPRHTAGFSIGARGLTGEMYEGSIFWDTEIFMLPYFTMTDPEAAKNLLLFRYHSLGEAKEHAIDNRFSGAMYGWQVNDVGIEQTPRHGGAYYSLHIIADVAFAVLEYWHGTGDDDFIWDYGLEMLIETARFWASRVTKREDGLYDLMAVRGPNEYDVLVNNNLYTNMMARENFLLCEKIMGIFSSDEKRLKAIKDKLLFEDREIKLWQEISDHIVLPFHEGMNLWLEDDTWLRRKPLDLKKAKPTRKRIIDSTMSAEELPFYQVTKQADVLHLMKNLPWHFSQEQIEIAYEHYKPRTAFDSSLAYSMFALMSARLGHTADALCYFDASVNLDIRNVQMNTISGLHFANFGGSWQAAIFGFGGVMVMEDKLSIQPALPKEWQSMKFHLFYRKALLEVVLVQESTTVNLLNPGIGTVKVALGSMEFELGSAQKQAYARRDSL